LGDLDRVDQVVKVNNSHFYPYQQWFGKFDLTRPLKFQFPFNERFNTGVWNCSVYHWL
jgi:hypothetical protein